MNSSPADVIKKLLVDAQLVSLPVAKAPWPCYVSSLPDGDAVADDAVALYDTSPRLDGRLMRSGSAIDHPGIQVKVRSTEYRKGWGKIAEIAARFDSTLRQAFVIDEYTHTVQSISAGGILPIGQEEGTTTRRHLFTLNCHVTLSSVLTQP